MQLRFHEKATIWVTSKGKKMTQSPKLNLCTDTQKKLHTNQIFLAPNFRLGNPKWCFDRNIPDPGYLNLDFIFIILCVLGPKILYPELEMIHINLSYEFYPMFPSLGSQIK